jgi:hypothetical protein
MFRSAGLACCFFVGMAAQAAEIPEMPVARRSAMAVVVNCNQGQSIQAAVDANPAPVEILITGICVENVLIRDKDVTLRGTQKPSLDGIRSAIASIPALTVRGSVIAEISDLSFRNSAGTGLAIRGGARMTVANCVFENGIVGLRVDSGAFVVGNGLTFTGNANSDTNTSDAQFFCVACDFNGSGPAAVSTRGAIVSLNDCVATGSLGIVADEVGALVDFDCASSDTQHGCTLTVPGPAAISTVGGTARLIGTGNFIGQLIADDRGTIRLDGAVQRAGSSNGQPNIVDTLGEIIVAPLLDDAHPPAPSLILDTVAAHFARVLVTDGSILKGSIQCTGAADAFLDPTVIRSPGSSVTGCEHGSAR